MDEEITAEMRHIIDELKKLTEDQRTTIFYQFCRYCGSLDPRCQCWNDD